MFYLAGDKVPVTIRKVFGAPRASPWRQGALSDAVCLSAGRATLGRRQRFSDITGDRYMANKPKEGVWSVPAHPAAESTQVFSGSGSKYSRS